MKIDFLEDKIRFLGEKKNRGWKEKSSINSGMCQKNKYSSKKKKRGLGLILLALVIVDQL
jgi:hypothetical protein